MLSDPTPQVTTGPGLGTGVAEITRSKPKSLLTNALWNLFPTVWAVGVGFVLTPLLIGHIGTDHYGLYVLVMSISGLMGIMNLGLGEATLRYVAYYYARDDLAGINRIVGATFSVFTVMGVLGWAILFFGAPRMAGLLALSAADVQLGVALLRLTAINFAVLLVSGAYSPIPRALQRYDVNTQVGLVQSALLAAGTVVIILSGWGIYRLVLWSVVTTLLTQVINIVVVRRMIPRIRLRPLPSREGLREVFGHGVFSLINNVLYIIWTQADRLLLGMLVGPAAVAYLTVPQNLAFRGSGAVISAGDVLFPRFSATEDVQEGTRLFLDATWITLCATIVIFVPMTLLLPDFLRLWVGPEFARQSAWVGQVIAFGSIVRGAFVPYVNLFGGGGKPQYQAAANLAIGLTSLALNLLLIPRFGLAGAGYSYVATTVWGFAAVVFAWKGVLHMGSVRPLGRAVALPTGLAVVALVLGALLRSSVADPGWIGLFALGAILMTGTAALVVATEWSLGGWNSHLGRLLRSIRFSLAGWLRLPANSPRG